MACRLAPASTASAGADCPCSETAAAREVHKKTVFECMRPFPFIVSRFSGAAPASISVVGRTPTSVLNPLVRLFEPVKTESDEGVGRGPGDRPTKKQCRGLEYDLGNKLCEVL